MLGIKCSHGGNKLFGLMLGLYVSLGNKKNMDLFCIVLTYWIKSSRSSKQIHLFSSYLIRFFVPLPFVSEISISNIDCNEKTIIR